MRQDGHLIEGKLHGAADWFYCLIRDNGGEKPSSGLVPSEGEYMGRIRQEQEQVAPPFEGAQSGALPWQSFRAWKPAADPMLLSPDAKFCAQMRRN